jgi:hypothetical protein
MVRHTHVSSQLFFIFFIFFQQPKWQQTRDTHMITMTIPTAIMIMAMAMALLPKSN